jgi:hypothetical protein
MSRIGESDIARRIKTVEWSKSELLEAVSSLFRSSIQGRDDGVLESLGNVLLAAYLLAPHLGISYPQLDLQLEAATRRQLEKGHRVEEWYSDLSNLLRYLEGRGREF